MTENKGSSQPKMVKWEVQSKKNKNISEKNDYQDYWLLLIAFIVLVLLGIFIICVLCMKAPAFTESKLQDPKPAKFTTEMVT